MLSYLFEETGEDERAVSQAVAAYFDNGAESSMILEAIHWSEDILGKTEKSSGRRDYLFSRIAHESRRQYAKVQQQLGEISHILDAFKTRLLAARSYSALPLIMQAVFPSLGIKGALLMMYEDFHYTEMLGGFSEEKIFTESIRFPRGRIVPETLSLFLDKGTFVVEPLYYENQELGYILLAVQGCEGHVLEDIRSSLSSAIRGISLTEVAQKAAESAEMGERKAGEFYASVSEALRGPLTAIHALLAADGAIPRKNLEDEVRRAEQMLSLSLAEFGELDMEKSLVPLSVLASRLSEKLGAIVDIPSDMPSVEIDEDKIEELVGMLALENPAVSISLRPSGVAIAIRTKYHSGLAWQFAERIAVLHSGSISSDGDKALLFLPYPALSGHPAAGKGTGPVVWLSGADVPESVRHLDPLVLREEEAQLLYRMDPPPAAIAWRKNSDTHSGAALLRLLRSHRLTRSLPFMVFGAGEKAVSLTVALECDRDCEDAVIYMSHHIPILDRVLSDFGRIEEDLAAEEILMRDTGKPRLVVLTSADSVAIASLRRSKRFSAVPVLIVKDIFTEAEVADIDDIPGVMIVNTPVLEAPAFIERLVSVMTGGELLPPLTGALVKRAIAYLNRRLSKQISRWQLAESVNISEDYLTRIFRREMGVSPWDYLNRCRVGVAEDLLHRTGAPLSEIAVASGFQDQAYFSRVFRKIKGFPPGQIRQGNH